MKLALRWTAAALVAAGIIGGMEQSAFWQT